MLLVPDMYVVHVERPDGALTDIPTDEHDVPKAVRGALISVFGGGTTLQFDKEPLALDTDYFVLATRLLGVELVTDVLKTRVRVRLCPETKKRLDVQLREVEAQLGGEQLAEPLRAQLVSFWLRSAA